MSASINENERIVNVVFLSEIAEEHQVELLILDGKYVKNEGIHLYEGRRQRTARIYLSRSESQSRQPQRDSVSHRQLAVDRPFESSCESLSGFARHPTSQDTVWYSKVIGQQGGVEYRFQ
jgi:hypothetical protein